MPPGASWLEVHVNPGGHAHVPAYERESAERFLADHLGDREVAAVPHGTGSASRTAGDQGRLRRSIVLRSQEAACEVLVDGRPVWARYATAFPTPRVSADGAHRLAHLHLLVDGARRWDEQLRFREALRGDDRLRDEYAALKRRLAESFVADREGYTDAKAAFIQAVLGA